MANPTSDQLNDPEGQHLVQAIHDRKAAAEKREQIIQSSMARGKTREQAEAFLDIVGSAFRRNGWAPGEPMTDEQVDKKLSTFLGTTDGESSADPLRRIPTYPNCATCDGGGCGDCA
ncbi:hypothetical protein SEA_GLOBIWARMING_66 [Arthrobacter phage GlobiWarming]|nr:hypothetical protein SEA_GLOBIWARMING_66 [Arthrobacter phage GlobiWarming]